MDSGRQQRIQALLESAKNRDRSEWSSLVSAACSDDPTLAQHILELLTATELGGTAMSDDELVGRQIGNYRVDRRIGEGGMGVVYRAEDLNLERPVAIKMLPRGLPRDPERLRRFRAEARAASSLNHPHILVVHDVGDVDMQPFIVTEWVEGRTLRERLRDGPMTVHDTIRVGLQIASALSAAHSKGIVHRDIKPENIMLRPDGYVKVLDFGLAKLVSASADGATQTQAGLIMGTAQYMSPEQAAGQPVDFRSDQFSLGVVLYELLTGRSPFRRATSVQAAAAVISDEVEPIARICPDVPSPLRWTIERCLAKNAQERFPSTDELHRELVTVHDRFSDTHPQSTPLPPSNLPGKGTPLVGRAADTAAVTALLNQDAVRWVTITGAGGVGKTRLTIHVAREVQKSFGGAVYFVPLGSVFDGALVPSAIAEALDVRPNPDESAFDAVARVLSSVTTPVLLVLDNFEQVSNAAVQVAELLDCCEALKVLVSSRFRVNVSAEHEAHLAPLPTNAAVDLFVERARAARPDFTLSADNSKAVADICAALDGLPLALELAAARVKMLSPHALLTRIASKRLSLTGGARDLPTRQQTLRATIDWGYELLTPAEQKLFRRLAVFVGGWTIEAAEAVCDAQEDLGIDVFDGISSLVDKSLVQPMDDVYAEPRFTMLGTIREYAAERLAASDDAALVGKAHAAYCLVLAEEGAATQAVAQIKWLDRCDAEHPNFRAALDYLMASRQAQWAMRLACALVPFWQARAYLSEAEMRLRTSAAIVADGDHRALRARSLFLLGATLHSMGRFEECATLVHREALPLYEQLGDRNGMAATLNAVGISRSALGEYREARRAYERAIELWRAVDQHGAAVKTIANLANLTFEEGKYEQAIQLYREAREGSERTGDAVGAAWAINFEAWAEQVCGNGASAAALLNDALGRFRALDDSWGEADSLLCLALVSAEAGRADESRQRLLEAQRILQRIGDVRGSIRVIEACAQLHARQARSVVAMTLAGAAAALRQTLHAPHTRAQHEALERALDLARRQLAAQEASAAWMEGWSLSLDAAIALAFDERRDVSGS